MAKLIKQYEMETQITQEMAQKWGYSRRQGLTNRKKRISVNGFDVLEIKPFPRVGQSFDTSIIEQNPRSFADQKGYMKLTEGLFKQFNYIVSYKNCKAKKEVIEIRDPEPKTEMELIEEEIRDAKEEIRQNPNQHDLESQFRLHNKLNHLFRKFHRASKQKVKTASFRSTRANSFNSKAWRDESRHKTPQEHYEIVKETKRMESLLEPFDKVHEESFMESKRIETKISHEKEIIDLYKGKIDEMKKSKIKQNRSEQQIAQVDHVSRDNCETEPNCQIYEMKMARTNHKVDFQKLAQNKERKQKIFTKILKNKNAKYIRSKGTNCLIKYDECEEAKQLLSGKMRPSQQPNHNQEVEKRENTRSTNDYDIAVMGGPPKKIPNTRDYDAEFRNQKVQASMRFRRQ